MIAPAEFERKRIPQSDVCIKSRGIFVHKSKICAGIKLSTRQKMSFPKEKASVWCSICESTFWNHRQICPPKRVPPILVYLKRVCT